MTRGHRRASAEPVPLHIDEVRTALARRGVTKIREAFRRLIHWPRAGTIDGIATADDAMALLRDLSAALVRKHDTRVMPYETMALLERIAADQGGIIVGGWYATGAMFVQGRTERWHETFERAFSTEE